MYNNIKSEYHQMSTLLNETKLNLSWILTDRYRKEFNCVFGKSKYLPNRAFLSSLSNPVLCSLSFLISVYLNSFHGYEKLIVLQKKGCCEEFAIATAKLLHDVLGVKTRVIHIEGFDHAFPEIWLNNSWWVIDRMFTTQDKPVKAKLYAKYLKDSNMSVYRYIYNLKEHQTGHSVLAEHGFKSVNVTIVAIIDPTPNKSDDIPARGAELEIFALKNWYDPLIDKGKTDNKGEYKLTLRKYGKIILLARSSDNRFAGVLEINSSKIKDGDKITVYLHKYG